MNSEQHALGVALLISKELYRAIAREEIANAPALLDSMSAVLSHLNDPKQPLSRVVSALKRELKAKDKAFFGQVKQYFVKLYPVVDFDFAKAERHVPAIICGNDKICAQFVRGEREKAAAMCDAMKSYPGFLFGEFEALGDSKFYDLVFGYYPKLYEKEDFMGEMRHLFKG